MVSVGDAIATCLRRLAGQMASGLRLQVIDTDFAGPRFEVAAVRRAGQADAGLDWLVTKVREAVL